MPKQNSSDYRRWANRKGTTYLRNFIRRYVHSVTVNKLLNGPEFKRPHYLERKILAARWTLQERGEEL